jgi:hypothetical protein
LKDTTLSGNIKSPSYQTPNHLLKIENFDLYKKFFPKILNEKDPVSAFLNQPIGIQEKGTFENEIVVSLTSFPARIKTVFVTIDSLLCQSLKPNHIILYLAEEEFPSKEIPEALKAQQKRGLEIHWVQNNYRPYNKLVHALKEYPEAVIITVDDDAFYEPSLLEEFYLEHLKNPKNIISKRYRAVTYDQDLHVKGYNQWCAPQVKDSSFFIFPTGLGGILYPPHSLDEMVSNEVLFMELCPYQDDIWFWAMAVKNNTTFSCLEFLDTPNTDNGSTALYVYNSKKDPNNLTPNDYAFHKTMSHFNLYEKLNIKPNLNIIKTRLSE